VDKTKLHENLMTLNQHRKFGQNGKTTLNTGSLDKIKKKNVKKKTILNISSLL